MPRILLVEDDVAIRSIMERAFEREGMSVKAIADGEAALKSFRSVDSFDVVVLDIMLPGVDGITLCQELRKSSNVPIVMLTARDGERNVVMGLEVGADDYVSKPVSPLEVVSRVRAHLRRRRMDGRAPDQKLTFPGLAIDLLRRQVSVQENLVDLT
ncbi:MAG TPA: response regulator, partial [Rubrobacteraceae bacterium]|nr:response regulator [Rubrobacteraceae bacterium]